MHLPTTTLSIDQSNHSPGFLNFQLIFKTLKMASAQVFETSVTNRSPTQDSSHPDDLFQSRQIGFVDCSTLDQWNDQVGIMYFYINFILQPRNKTLTKSP